MAGIGNTSSEYSTFEHTLAETSTSSAGPVEMFLVFPAMFSMLSLMFPESERVLKLIRPNSVSKIRIYGEVGAGLYTFAYEEPSRALHPKVTPSSVLKNIESTQPYSIPNRWLFAVAVTSTIF